MSADSPLHLSVLVPVLNERHLVVPSLLRLLEHPCDSVDRLEVIVVDDASTDGTTAVLSDFVRQRPQVRLVTHPTTKGKGACIRTALEYATGNISLIHDADLEYSPADIPALLVPFLDEGADAVFGSRYLSGAYRRALGHRRALADKSVTFLSNCLTDLGLTDVRTSYKAVKTSLLRSMPLRSDGFGIDIELVSKLAKRKAHVFEVPIRYLPRSEAEGRKSRIRDLLAAYAAAVKYAFYDDIYHPQQYGTHILNDLQHARRFNLYMGDTIRPYVGDRVLEIGAGIGTLTNQLIPRAEYVASDIEPSYLDYLRSYAVGKPYLDVRHIDACELHDFDGLEGRFDTVVILNVLEHVGDERGALQNIHRSLCAGGRAIVLVPQGPRLYNSLDEALGHRERYTRQGLQASLEAAGFRVVGVTDFNRFSVPGWWINGTVLRRRTFSRTQLKVLELLLPVLRRLDPFLPWNGQSLLAIAERPP